MPFGKSWQHIEHLLVPGIILNALCELSHSVTITTLLLHTFYRWEEKNDTEELSNLLKVTRWLGGRASQDSLTLVHTLLVLMVTSHGGLLNECVMSARCFRSVRHFRSLSHNSIFATGIKLLQDYNQHSVVFWGKEISTFYFWCCGSVTNSWLN